MRGRIVKANAVKEKLDFVLRVVNQWIANGGMGRLNDDEGEGRGRELSWDGLGAKAAAKHGVVTVGRYGGDIACS